MALTDERKVRKAAYERSWRAADIHKIREGDRRRYAENPEKYRAERRARYAKNPAKYKAQTKQSGLRNLEKRMLLNASYRHQECTITLDDIKIPDVCPVYGISLDRSAPARSPNKPSLDRVDNTKGYVSGNVRVISWAANNDKSNLSMEQLLALAEYIIEHKAQHPELWP